MESNLYRREMDAFNLVRQLGRLAALRPRIVRVNFYHQVLKPLRISPGLTNASAVPILHHSITPSLHVLVLSFFRLSFAFYVTHLPQGSACMLKLLRPVPPVALLNWSPHPGRCFAVIKI